MKTTIMFAAMILLTTPLPGRADDSLVLTNRSVNLTSSMERINTNWIGRVMSDVIGTNQVLSVVVLKNLTSMPTRGHAEGIRWILRADPTLMGRPEEIKSSGRIEDDVAAQFFCASIVVLSDGMIIRVERSRSWGRLTTEKGQAYFRISNERHNKAIDGD